MRNTTLAVVCCLCLLLCASSAFTQITWTGDVYPANPTSWSLDTTAYVGRTGTGTLNVPSDEGLSSKTAYIGDDSGASGTVTVDGADAIWYNRYTMHVGPEGTGVLNIANGGLVSVGRNIRVSWLTGSGTINFNNGTLSTEETLWCDLSALTGTGTINTQGLVFDGDVEFGSTYASTGSIVVNNDPGQNITVNLTVDGSGSMGAGYGGGHGTMTISDGVAINSSMGYIATSSGSTGTVTVDGAGSSWTASGRLYVGDDGAGVLNITNGGTVSSDDAYVGGGRGSSGTVTVDGAGSSWVNTDVLPVGRFGAGVLYITDGGTVSTSGGDVGLYSDATGAVTVDGTGSLWTCSDTLRVGINASGTLRLHDGGLVSVTSGDAIFASTGAFEIGLSGAPAESLLDVAGMATLAGWADVSLLGGFSPALGTEFLILDAASLNGVFESFSFPNGQNWTVDYDTLAGDVSVTFNGWWVRTGDLDGDSDTDADDVDLICANIGGDPGLYDMDGDGDVDADDMVFHVETYLEFDLGSDGTIDGQGTSCGDFNADGVVDGTDLSIMNANFGGAVGFAAGNANCDSTVNGTDLSILAGTFGNVATAPVPEPATMGLFALGGLALLRKRRK